MKNLINALSTIAGVISAFVFISGIVITLLGIYDFFHAFVHLSDPDPHKTGALIAIGLVRGVDMFLIAMVLFVFSIGVRLLFSKTSIEELPIRIPDWLKIRDFMQLKIILWEAILTTMVVSYFSRLVQQVMDGSEITTTHLILPGAIFIISVSLFFLKKH